MKRGKCRGCGQEVLLGRTMAGRVVMLDPKVEKRFTLIGTSPDGVKQVDSYDLHSATCPQAAAFSTQYQEPK